MHVLRSLPRPVLTLAAGSVLILGIVAAPGTRALLAGALAAPQGPVDPKQACAVAGGRCDPVAEAARVAENVEAQAPTGIALSRTRVEQLARGLGKTPLTPQVSDTAPTFSALMSRSAFEAVSGEAHNYAVNPDRQVWVVTVHANMATDGSPGRAPQVFPVYSVAMDAETGQWTDYCVGCEWLTASK